VQAPGLDVEHEAEDRVAVEQEGRDPQAADRLPDVLVRVPEGLEHEARRVTQSVCWTITIPRVPIERCDWVSERITSSVTTPPALRMTCASPGSSPSSGNTGMRESMHATTAIFRAGHSGRMPAKRSRT
jgi:hypothetical protein